MHADVFADALDVTLDPLDWRPLRLALLPLFDQLGLSTVLDVPAESSGQWRTADGRGTFITQRHPTVTKIGASGHLLGILRTAKLLDTFLSHVGSHPHKVTRLDASMDLPVDAPPLLRQLLRRARTGDGLQLTRKRVPKLDVDAHLSLRLDNRLSGTGYFGSRTAPVRLCVYDKQHEQQSKGAFDAPPCLRYELRFRNGQPTLRDVSAPAAIFWHHMSGILRPPVGVLPWSPSQDPFRPTPTTLDPDYRLRRRVESSPDLRAMVSLARQMHGSSGLDVLLREIVDAYPLPVVGKQVA